MKFTKEYIVNGVNTLTKFRPCLKQEVFTVLVTKDGQEFFGSNEMKACISICPREELNIPSGQGYHHCKETCHQDFHGEHQSCDRAEKAEADTNDSIMYIVGHHYCCDNCLNVMRNANVSKVVYVEENYREEILS